MKKLSKKYIPKSRDQSENRYVMAFLSFSMDSLSPILPITIQYRLVNFLLTDLFSSS